MTFNIKHVFSYISVILIFLFTEFNFYSIAYANNDESVIEKLADGWVVSKYMYSQVGAFFLGDLDKTIANSESLKSYFDNGVKTTETTKDGKTTVTIDPDFVQALYDATSKAISDNGEYTLLTSTGTTPESFIAKTGISMNPGAYLAQVSLMKSQNFLCNMSTRSNSYYQFDNNKYYFYKYNSTYCQYDPATDKTSNVLSFELKSTGSVSMSYSCSVSVNKDYYGVPIRVYNSLMSLNRYLGNSNKFYVGSNFYNFNPQGSLTINKDVLYGNDWDKVNSDMYSNIKNAIDDASADGSVLSPGEQQAIIDDLVNKLLEAIGSVNDNLGDMSGTLDSILSSITSSGNNQVAWLSKIYDLLNTKLESLGGSGSSGGGITREQFDAIITRLDSTNSKLDTLISQADDLSKEIEDSGGMNSLMGGLFTKFQPLGEKAKTKFPTSIPWDVGLVVSKLASTPECPRYVLPLKLPAYGVNQEVVLDLKDFEPLSKASRSMLSLTFILFLAILTRNLFGGDK